MKRRLIAAVLSAGLALSAVACEGEVDANLEEGVEGEIGEGEGEGD